MVQGKHTISVSLQVEGQIRTRLLPLMEEVESVLDVVEVGEI